MVAASVGGGQPDLGRLTQVTGDGHGAYDVLQSAGLLFFAFAGYARIATQGEEVRDPARTIPRAIQLALAGAVTVYTAVAVTVLAVLGPGRVAASDEPLTAAVRAGSWDWAAPVVQVAGALAALGALLALLAGIGRTSLAMAREGDLPRWLAAVHPRYRVPHHAQVALAVVITVLVPASPPASSSSPQGSATAPYATVCAGAPRSRYQTETAPRLIFLVSYRVCRDSCTARVRLIAAFDSRKRRAGGMVVYRIRLPSGRSNRTQGAASNRGPPSAAPGRQIDKQTAWPQSPSSRPHPCVRRSPCLFAAGGDPWPETSFGVRDVARPDEGCERRVAREPGRFPVGASIREGRQWLLELFELRRRPPFGIRAERARGPRDSRQPSVQDVERNPSRVRIAGHRTKPVECCLLAVLYRDRRRLGVQVDEERR
jgi:Amino acid permease